jgi:hypothetical protein
VAALKSEIAFLKGEQGEAVEMTEDEEASLYSSAKTWVNSGDDTVPFDIGAFTVRAPAVHFPATLTSRVVVANVL